MLVKDKKFKNKEVMKHSDFYRPFNGTVNEPKEKKITKFEKPCLQNFLVLENSISNVLLEINSKNYTPSPSFPVLVSNKFDCFFGWSENEATCEICEPNFSELMLFRKKHYESTENQMNQRHRTLSRSSKFSSNLSLDSKMTASSKSKQFIPELLSTIHEDIGCLLIKINWTANDTLESVEDIEKLARRYGSLIKNSTTVLNHPQNSVVVKFKHPARAMVMLKDIYYNQPNKRQIFPYSSTSNFIELNGEFSKSRFYRNGEKENILYLNTISKKYIDWIEDLETVSKIKIDLNHLLSIFGLVVKIDMEMNEYCTIFKVYFVHKQSIDLVKQYRNAYHDRADHGRFEIDCISFVPAFNDEMSNLRNN